MKLSELPKGWVWTTVGELYDIVSGGTPSTKVSEYWNGDIPWITSADIHNLKDIRPRRCINLKAIQNSATNLVPDGSLIVVTRVGLGKIALTKTPICFSQDSQALIGDQSLVSPDYSLYYLSQAVQIFKYRHRGTTIAGVTKKQLSELVFPLSPLPEQHRIVTKVEELFTRLDAGVGALTKSRTQLKRYRQSVLKSACEGRLVPTEAELARAEGRDYEPADVLLARIRKERREKWGAEKKRKGRKSAKHKEPAAPDVSGLPELPGGWCWATVEQLGDIDEQAVLTGPFGSNLGRQDFIDSGVPVLTIGCLTEQGLSLEKAVYVSKSKASELGRYKVKAGDILFSRMATVGRAGLVSIHFEDAIINYHLMRLRLAVTAIDPVYFITQVRGSKTVADYITVVNHGATRDGINTRQLLSLPVALPPLLEQHHIVAEIERRLSVADEIEKTVDQSLKQAERLRQSILKRAFEGKLVPQDLNDEPASVLLEQIKKEKSK